ncbi:trehalase isoform X2 [Rhinatrema bivittatum]|uniref:trehalase isoform X2 n=1 Tax=Rhinatrema bivittatum TaxID=194408 RepID=UPI00112BA203|nr:trehalase isoform X2 [Rhinatrema bivittatum]
MDGFHCVVKLILHLLSPIYCTGDLLKRVQTAKLFTDDKHFVDMVLREPPEQVLQNFQNLLEKSPGGNLSRDELFQFVNLSFAPPGQEFEPWTPKDWPENPQILKTISDEKLNRWAKELHAIWKSLGRKMKNDVQNHPELHSLIYVPYPVVVPGGRFREFYYWDSYWVINGLLVSEMKATAKGMIENFLYLVERYGLIPNGGRVYYLRRSQPPFLTLMMDSYMAKYEDSEFLRLNIHLLEQEYEFWMSNRSVIVSLGGKNYTLNRYNVQVGEPRPESYSVDLELAGNLTEEARQELWAELKSAAESGWDFSSRWYAGGVTKQTGTLRDTKTSAIVPVDLNAVLCQTERLLASFYKMLGNLSKVQKFEAARTRRLEAVQAVFWDTALGIWLDFNLVTKQRNKAFYPTNLAPLWAECIMDQSLVEMAVRYLEESEALSYRNGIPTSLYQSGQQWDFPNAWPPLQHIVIEGLAKSSSARAQEMAFQLAQNWIRTNYAAYEKYKAMFEKYDVNGDGKPGGGGEYDVQEGFGWTNGVALQLLERYGSRLVSGADTVGSSLAAAVLPLPLLLLPGRRI